MQRQSRDMPLRKLNAYVAFSVVSPLMFRGDKSISLVKWSPRPVRSIIPDVGLYNMINTTCSNRNGSF